MPYFSIITINLNNASGLLRTIISVLSQSCENFEYIIIDGGSKDGSVEVIKNYAGKISYWISERDSGVYDAMNKGIAVTKGEYCLFLNSGDCLYDNYVLQRIFEQKLESDIVYGDLILEKNGVMTGVKIHPDKISSVFLYLNCIGHQAQFIKKELFIKYGYYSTAYKLSSDYEFFVKLYFKTNLKTKHILFPISGYDITGISSSQVNIEMLNSERKMIQMKYFPKIYLLIFSFYDSLLKSRLIKNTIISVPIKYFNKCIVKIFDLS